MNDLQHKLQRSLRPSRTRLHTLRTLRAAMCGVWIGLLCTLVWIIVRFLTGQGTAWGGLWLPAIGLVIGGVVGIINRPKWLDVARRVDHLAQLKDAAVSAWEFAGLATPTTIQRFQIEDSVERLAKVEATRILPIRMPKSLPTAAVVFAMTLGCTWWLVSQERAAAETQAARRTRSRGIAEKLQAELLEDIAQLADEPGSDAEAAEPIKDLKQQLEKMIDHLSNQALEESDVLVTLSQMQAAIEQLLDENQAAAVEANLKELGVALSQAESMQKGADALKRGELAEAAKEMEQVDPESIQPHESQALTDELDRVAQKMTDEDEHELADATGEFSHAIKANDSEKIVEAFSQLTHEVKVAAAREAIETNLQNQLNRLADAKTMARSGGTNNSPSSRPKQTWGKGTDRDPFRTPADAIASQRQREQLEGTLGEGESERERVRVEDVVEDSSRSYGEVHREYQQQAESVLAHEALPAGRRLIVRDYFEAIRPRSGQGE